MFGRYDYNLVVIGGGAAGLVSSYIAATVGAKVALIEKHEMGGDCLNTGCVPSKALLRTAKLLAEARRASEFGLQRLEPTFDFSEVMERVQRVIRTVAPHDSVERYSALGVECIRGNARIVGPHRVEVDGRVLITRSIIVATGASPLVPAIGGLAEVPWLTSDTVWNLRELPARLVVLGGGPIGCELAQAFARLGSAVTLIERGDRLLPREDPEVSSHVAQRMAAEGVTVLTGHSAVAFARIRSGFRVVCARDGEQVPVSFDKVLIALGRRPNTHGFGLEELGVKLAPVGTIGADRFLRTSMPSIWVCGDVAGPYQFTHTAAHQAWYASLNALLAPFKRFEVDYRIIPWATFTDPEVARVGLNQQEALAKGVAFELTTYGLDDLDRAIADEHAHGFVQVLTPPGKDRILGVTIVGAHAGELLAEFVLAMKHGLGLNKILNTIHIYPTHAEANKYVAGAWKRAHAPQWALKLAERFFRWRRGA